MTSEGILQNILENSNYHLTLFTKKEIENFSSSVFLKELKNKKVPYYKCVKRNSEHQLYPEEIVRQLFTQRLITHYNYPKSRIEFEHPVNFGREIKKADIVIFDRDRVDSPYIIVELKKPNLKDGKNQLRSYCNATGAPIGVWTNGQQISYYHRKDPNYFEDITDIPNAEQSLKDILSERFTLKDLIIRDKISNERKSLKDIILEMEDEVLANAGVDVFEEVFKLIFTKLYDEILSKTDKTRIDDYIDDNLNSDERADYEKIKETLLKINDKKFRTLEFRNTGQTETELYQKILSLFDKAKEKWPGVFPESSIFDLSPSHLSICVSSLQDVKLFNSNLLVVDEAFEYLVNKSSKGEKGQYFTPRHVIDMCVKMLNPKRGEYMIDPAAGSCGFPVHTIFHITGNLFTNADISDENKEDILRIFGIDFDEKTVRVARTLNLIAGDGETNILHLNSLDYERWSDKEKDRKWLDTYGKGYGRLENLRKNKNDNKEFLFDIVMANPPFAGDIKESRVIHKYELGFNEKGKALSKVGRDILFIERNLEFLKPGGRMAIVLPQGRFNNTNNKETRKFITRHARILAVVGLHLNTFKPHTGTKTSVLFIQKWDSKLCSKKDDYPIFFAVSEKAGKNNSGDYEFVKNGNGQYKLDKNGHLIVEHDLHNHNGELPNGIAELFIEFAKKEKLSFWQEN